MTARFIVSHPCEDACGTLRTDRVVDGAPVHRCPGCDSEWIEEHETTATRPSAVDDAAGSAAVDDAAGSAAVDDAAGSAAVDDAAGDDGR